MTHLALENATPKEVAEKLSRVHDPDWIRSVVTYLDQSLRKNPLDRLMTLWALSGAEAAQLFGVSRQAFAKWLELGPPMERAAAVAALADATNLLERHVKRERIPIVVRRPAPITGNKSLIDLAREGKYEKVLTAVRRMFDLRRVQP